MLYTIAETAKAIALKKSLILKAIDDGQVSGTTNVSGEWHVEDEEVQLLYLSTARFPTNPHSLHHSVTGARLHWRVELVLFF
jgi:hypothetical protein